MAVAVGLGGLSFLLGLSLLIFGGVGAFVNEEEDPAERLGLLNIVVGSGVVNLVLGGVLVYQAASSLGGSSSARARLPARLAWPLLLAFPALIGLGQWQVLHPETLPWMFPFVNVGIVSIPSLIVTVVAARAYNARHPAAWPLSWREFGSAIVYGAVGATNVAGIINTLYLVFMGLLLIGTFGDASAGDLNEGLRTLPKGWGVFFDVSVLSICAPINEEFWKGFLVSLFFFRRGGVARCYLWGVLAGAGFNILETFSNSLSIVDPQGVAGETIGNEWWLFAVARAGTAVVHSSATGLAAIGFYAVLNRERRYLWGYPAGVGIHAAWNFLNYVMYGDAFLTGAGPDSRLLDYASFGGLVLMALTCAVLIWGMSRNMRDARPAAIYQMLGLVPTPVPRPP